jgi:hypothetical protein
VTPKVISNINEYIEGDMDLFDGYDGLPDDIQAKVKRALDQGHVDDEDWKGVSLISSLSFVFSIAIEGAVFPGPNHQFFSCFGSC